MNRDKRYLDRLHPIAALCYFAFMLLLAFLSSDPVSVSVCYVFGVLLSGMIAGMRHLPQSLAYSLPITLMIALLNPMFVHRGETILFFLNDNPVTKESIICGAFIALKVMAVFYWLKCFFAVMTSEKTVFLLGRAMPKAAVFISACLKFIPMLKHEYKAIDDAQKALGIYRAKSIVDKLKCKMRVVSALLTTSIEAAADSAKVMSSRGYGLQGRSSLNTYRFNASDAVFLAATIVLGFACVSLKIAGAAEFDYYPLLQSVLFDAKTLVYYAALVILAAISVITEVKENILWRYLRSKL